MDAQRGAVGEWWLAKSLQRRYEDELKALRERPYNNLFRPAAATVETGRQVYVGDVEDADGNVERAFEKDQIF